MIIELIKELKNYRMCQVIDVDKMTDILGCTKKGLSNGLGMLRSNGIVKKKGDDWMVFRRTVPNHEIYSLLQNLKPCKN